MKVFITWSGETSRAAAMALHRWLPCVIQSLRPYLSEEDISKGSRWAPSLARALEDTSFGIACVTPDALREPWLHFEAGAISKEVKESRLCPFLVGLGKSDLIDPLSQFQAAEATREDVLKLVQSLNKGAEQPLSDQQLITVFEKFWPDLDKDLERISSDIVEKSGEAAEVPEAMSQEKRDRILEEVLEIARAQRRATPSGARTPAWVVDENSYIWHDGDPSRVLLASRPARDLLRVLLDVGHGRAVNRDEYPAFFRSGAATDSPLSLWFADLERGTVGRRGVVRRLARELVRSIDPDTIDGVDQVVVNAQTGALSWSGSPRGEIDLD